MLRRIYRRIPVVRELINLRETLLQLQLNHQCVTQCTQLLYEELAFFSAQSLRLERDKIRHQILNESRYKDSKRLNRHEMQLFSQNGEDGIITEIFRRIGVATKTFVEIGVQDGTQNNTAFLLHQGWSGWWVERDIRAVEKIRQLYETQISHNQLNLIEAHITAENVQGLLQIPGELDLLSLDIDRNTYWVWAAMKCLRPRVLVVEYNAFIPPSIDWKVEYDPERSWDGTAYFGGSLKAFELLGRERGYSLVGCDLNGVNAFFVRDELCEDKFESPHTSEHLFEPLRYSLIQSSTHRVSFNERNENQGLES